MYKLIAFLISLQLLQIPSCTDSVVAESLGSEKFVGTWILKGKFLGDAIDTPCGYATKVSKELTLEIVADGVNKYKFSGQSPVNVFNGNFEITSNDSKLNITYINISQLGSSKMAGPPDLMECETYLFNFINEAKELRLGTDKDLYIGRFKKDNIPSRDGGTFLMYERK